MDLRLSVLHYNQVVLKRLVYWGLWELINLFVCLFIYLFTSDHINILYYIIDDKITVQLDLNTYFASHI